MPGKSSLISASTRGIPFMPDATALTRPWRQRSRPGTQPRRLSPLSRTRAPSRTRAEPPPWALATPFADPTARLEAACRGSPRSGSPAVSPSRPGTSVMAPRRPPPHPIRPSDIHAGFPRFRAGTPYLGRRPGQRPWVPGTCMVSSIDMSSQRHISDPESDAPLMHVFSGPHIPEFRREGCRRSGATFSPPPGGREGDPSFRGSSSAIARGLGLAEGMHGNTRVLGCVRDVASFHLRGEAIWPD